MPEPRDIATRIVRTLRDAGETAYFAGGCVRDELLGLRPKDYDVATSAVPAAVRGLFRSVSEVGASFGVMLVRIEGVVVEVATFREEGAYSDSRRPDAVRFSTPEADARRRDFTINALFLDPLREGDGVIDHVGGRADLAARLIRAVGSPDDRLREDHLRALRGVRLAARLGFAIEPGTRAAIAAHASELRGVSRERIGEELRKMLAHPARAAAARDLEVLGLDASALDEPHIESGVSALRALPEDAGFAAALAAWAVDRSVGASAPSGFAAAVGALGPEIARRWRRSLCLSNDETDAVADALTGLSLLAGRWETLGAAGKKRTASSRWFPAASWILAACLPEIAARVASDVEDLAREPGGLHPSPLISGDDLEAAGLAPGPVFRRLLDAAYDAQLEHRVRNRAEALALALRLASGGA